MTHKPKTIGRSGSGLSPSDEKMLSKLLAELEPIIAYKHLLGGQEAASALSLRSRLKNRLAPEAPDTLAADAKSFVDTYGPQLERTVRGIKAREEEAARLGAAHKAARDARSAEIAARLKEQEERRLAQIEVMRQLG